MTITSKRKKDFYISNRQEKNPLEHVKEAGADILQSPKFRSSKWNIQHGTTSVMRHSINVAKMSVMITEKFSIKCNRDEMIRGALLHDYFLYDWHDKEHVGLHHLHGFYHPGVALKNAIEDYELTPREKDIIEKHMWPLTLKTPKCREAWIVSAADKYCSFLETVRLIKGRINTEKEDRKKNRKGIPNA